MNYSSENSKQSSKLKTLFKEFDRDDNGKVDIIELTNKLKEDHAIDDKVIRKLLKVSDKNDDGRIDEEEFIEMVMDKRFQVLFGKYINNYVNFLVPPDKRRKFKPIGRRVGGASHVVDASGAYEEGCSCCPPPVCMILVSIVEIVCYFLNAHSSGNGSSVGSVGELLIYNPEKRNEFWRFLSYMLVHIGIIKHYQPPHGGLPATTSIDYGKTSNGKNLKIRWRTKLIKPNLPKIFSILLVTWLFQLLKI